MNTNSSLRMILMNTLRSVFILVVFVILESVEYVVRIYDSLKKRVINNSEEDQ